MSLWLRLRYVTRVIGGRVTEHVSPTITHSSTHRIASTFTDEFRIKKRLTDSFRISKSLSTD